MTKIKKLQDKFFKNPKTLKYKDIELVLISFGCKKINVKRGSHVKFKHSKLMDIIIPVHGGECKEFYKKTISSKMKKIVDY